MSAIGTKRTSASALHMSAFGGKADMPFCTAICLLLTQSGHRSVAQRPKNWVFPSAALSRYDALSEPRGRQ